MTPTQAVFYRLGDALAIGRWIGVEFEENRMSNHSEKVPKAMEQTFAAIRAITDDFCRRHLNEEYAQMIRYVTAALCRKRPSPLASGTARTWAAGITHAVGMVNFLNDATQTPYMTATALYAQFGVSQSSALAKSKQVRDLLRMSQLDPQWLLPSRVHDHPIVWMVQTPQGFIMDARELPREVQVALHRAGVIPYVHADRT
jgi:hypothetical protein